MEPQTAPVLVVFGVFGAAVGSFLNVVTYRVPLGRPLVRPRSRCPAYEARRTLVERLLISAASASDGSGVRGPAFSHREQIAGFRST